LDAPAVRRAGLAPPLPLFVIPAKAGIQSGSLSLYVGGLAKPGFPYESFRTNVRNPQITGRIAAYLDSDY